MCYLRVRQNVYLGGAAISVKVLYHNAYKVWDDPLRYPNTAILNGFLDCNQGLESFARLQSNGDGMRWNKRLNVVSMYYDLILISADLQNNTYCVLLSCSYMQIMGFAFFISCK